MNPRLRDWLILGGVTVISTLALWVSVNMKTIYENFDGPYYTVVARCWYDKECIGTTFSFPLPLEYYPAHFPLYPAIMAAFGFIGLLRAGVVINVAASAGGAIAIYEIFKKMKWGNPLFSGLVWLFAWPRMWVVRSIGSPESLFIVLVMLSLYWFHVKKFWAAGIAGALAVLTKSPGVLLFIAYAVAFVRKPSLKMWPVVLIPLSLAGLFYFYSLKTGDFWAYFHTGDNIHLQLLPFRIFDSNQAWVGTFWLEDVLWMYLIALIGVIRAFKKSEVWGIFGVVFYGVILFVSHRDVARYSLPLIPVVILGLSDILEQKEVRWALAFLIIPMFFYSVNFLSHNTTMIANWKPFL